MKNKISFFCIVTFLPLISFAGGTMQISGSVRNFDTERIEIEDHTRIYSIFRKKITGPQTAGFKMLRSGANLKLTVSFDAISDIRLKK